MGRPKTGELTPDKAPRKKPDTSNLKPAWLPGQSGNPAGRPVGNRVMLTENMLKDFAAFYKERGRSLLETVEQQNPGLLLQIFAKLIPKNVELSIGGAVDLNLTAQQRQRIAESWLLAREEKAVALEALEADSVRVSDKAAALPATMDTVVDPVPGRCDEQVRPSKPRSDESGFDDPKAEPAHPFKRRSTFR